MENTPAQRRCALGVALLFLLGAGSGPAGNLAVAAQHSEVHPSQSQVQSQVLAPSPARTTATRTTARWSGSVDTSNKTAVTSEYMARFASGRNVPTGWTGSNSRCIAGTQAPGARTATLRALNFARSLSGLGPVSFSTDLNSRSQLSALLMSANNALSHSPPSSWRCYTARGAANAGRSNLALAYPSITSAGLVAQYLEDAGSSNRAAGHRRWLLNPFATKMGSGSTDTANAITVIGPTARSRPNPAFVSWPTAGWFPNTLEPSGRWSLSLGNRALSLRWATVRVWRNGRLVGTTKHAVVDGYAQPTIVWQLPANKARSGTFKVQVSSIRASAGSKKYSRTYTVKMFTPAA